MPEIDGGDSSAIETLPDVRVELRPLHSRQMSTDTEDVKLEKDADLSATIGEINFRSNSGVDSACSFPKEGSDSSQDALIDTASLDAVLAAKTKLVNVSEITSIHAHNY